MIKIDSGHFMYVEPTGAASVPIVDDLTRKATALLRAFTPSDHSYRGVHGCTGRGCRATSDNRDYTTPDGRETHSLVVHYVACHRADLPAADLEFLTSLTDVVAEPTAKELG